MACGGQLDRRGCTRALTGATIAAANSAAWPVLSQRGFVNSGLTTLSGSGTQLGIGSAYAFVNEAGAEFRFAADAVVAASGGPAPFVNRGTLAKAGGAGSATLFLDIQYAGVVRVESGTFRVGVVTLVDSGAVEAVAGATLDLYRILGGAGSAIFGAGTVRFVEGASDFGGTHDVTGATEMVGGAASLTGSILGLGTLKVSDGDLDILAATIDLDVPSLLVTGGRLRGSSHLQVEDAMTWTGGVLAMGGSGSITSRGVMALGRRRRHR